MGVAARIAASVMGLISPQRSLVAEAPPSVIPSKPIGIPGGANFSGRLVIEPTEALRDQAGYGQAGTYNVGEWKLLALSNPYVTAGLDFILGPVADARIDVSPPPEESIGAGPGKLSEADAKLHTDFLKWTLTQHFRLEQHSEAAARGSLLSGFSLFEPAYVEAVYPGLPGRTVWSLKGLEQRLPNSLDLNPWLEVDGKLQGIRQNGPRSSGQWSRDVLEADKVLLYSWKREGNNWAGESQLRSTWYIAGRVMPMLLKLAGVTVQREGAGLPVAFKKDEAAPDLTPKQQQELMTFFANCSFHESSGFVAPPGWDIKWIFSPGSDKTFVIQMYEALGRFVLMQLGAQQLVLGTGATGSRSVGEVHDARAMAFVKKVLSFIASILNGDSGDAHTGLVKRLIDFNFGPQAAYPRVKLTPQRPELSPETLATSIKTAKDAGVFTPTLDDENAVRERMGLGPITEEARKKEQDEAAARAPQIGPGAESDKGGVPGPKRPPALSASAPRSAWKPWRALRASEQKLGLYAIDSYFTERRATYERKAQLEVAAMLALAGPAIHNAMADGKVTPAEVAAVPLNDARLRKMNLDFVRETAAAGASFLREELGDRPLTAAAGDEADPDVLEAVAEALTRRQVNRLRGEAEREAIDTVRTGGDASEVVTRTVMRQLDSGAFRGDGGSVITKSFNTGRDEAARQMGGIESVEYTAILDSETCEACQAMDGATAAFDSPEHDAMLPPNRDCAGRDNCRCLLILKRSEPGDNE